MKVTNLFVAFLATKQIMVEGLLLPMTTRYRTTDCIEDAKETDPRLAEYNTVYLPGSCRASGDGYKSLYSCEGKQEGELATIVQYQNTDLYCSKDIYRVLTDEEACENDYKKHKSRGVSCREMNPTDTIVSTQWAIEEHDCNTFDTVPNRATVFVNHDPASCILFERNEFEAFPTRISCASNNTVEIQWYESTQEARCGLLLDDTTLSLRCKNPVLGEYLSIYVSGEVHARHMCTTVSELTASGGSGGNVTDGNGDDQNPTTSPSTSSTVTQMCSSATLFISLTAAAAVTLIL